MSFLQKFVDITYRNEWGALPGSHFHREGNVTWPSKGQNRSGVVYPYWCHWCAQVSWPGIILSVLYCTVFRHRHPFAQANTEGWAIYLEWQVSSSLHSLNEKLVQAHVLVYPDLSQNASCSTNRCQCKRPWSSIRAGWPSHCICQSHPVKVWTKLQCHPKGMFGSGICNEAISSLPARLPISIGNRPCSTTMVISSKDGGNAGNTRVWLHHHVSEGAENGNPDALSCHDNSQAAAATTTVSTMK